MRITDHTGQERKEVTYEDRWALPLWFHHL
jgi:hypothetical protein